MRALRAVVRRRRVVVPRFVVGNDSDHSSVGGVD